MDLAAGVVASFPTVVISAQHIFLGGLHSVFEIPNHIDYGRNSLFRLGIHIFVALHCQIIFSTVAVAISYQGAAALKAVAAFVVFRMEYFDYHRGDGGEGGGPATRPFTPACRLS